jgi:hypothetical protein
MYAFLKSLFKYTYARSYEPKFQQGRFTILNHISTGLNWNNRNIDANCDAQVDFQVTGLPVDVLIQDTSHSYLGYNRRYIADDGTYDAKAALEDLTRNPVGSRIARDEIDLIVRTFRHEDSHAAYIYCMLISWYKAKLYKDTKGTENVIKIHQSGFSDSHMQFDHFGSADMVLEAKLGPPAESVEHLDVIFRNKENYWEKPYVLRYTAGSPEQVAFYIYHLAGSDGTSGINVDLRIPGIDTTQLHLDPIASDTGVVPNFAAVPWAKAETIWNWIADYVRLNRVEHEYVAALDILCALSAQPSPSSHEAHFWQGVRFEANFAAFSPTRAYIRSNVEGEPYQTDTIAHDFMVNDSVHPSLMLLNAALMNYIMWMGLAATVYNESQSYDDWIDVFDGYSGDADVLLSEHCRAYLISMVFNKECISYSQPTAFLTIRTEGMRGRKTIYGVDSVTKQQKMIKLNAVPAYVSGALVLGSVATDVQLYRNVGPKLSFAVSDDGTLSATEALHLATVYRLFGYDVILANERNGLQFTPYANHREILTMSHSVDDHAKQYDRVLFVSANLRHGKTDILPSPSLLRQLGAFTATFTIPTFEAVAWQTKRVRLQQVISLPGRRRAIEFKIRTGTAVHRATIKVDHYSKPMLDFRKAPVLPTPQAPVTGASTSRGVASEPMDSALEVVDPVASVE